MQFHAERGYGGSQGDHIGLRYAVELGLIGDVRSTLTALLPLLKRKQSREFLLEAQNRVREWNGLLDQVAAVQRSPLRPDALPQELKVCTGYRLTINFRPSPIKMVPAMRSSHFPALP